MKYRIVLLLFLGSSTWLNAQKSKSYDLKSSDGNISVHVEAATKLHWSVMNKGQPIITPSPISL